MALMSHEDFQYLISPENPVCTVLSCHWIAVKQIMARMTEAEYRVRMIGANRTQSEMDLDSVRWLLGWLKYLNRLVEPSYRKYIKWPLWVEAQLDREITCFGRKSQEALTEKPLESSEQI
jgi:hypothetical protein